MSLKKLRQEKAKLKLHKKLKNNNCQSMKSDCISRFIAFK